MSYSPVGKVKDANRTVQPFQILSFRFHSSYWLPGLGTIQHYLFQRQASYLLDDPASVRLRPSWQSDGLAASGFEPLGQLIRLVCSTHVCTLNLLGDANPTLAAPTGAAPASSRLTAGRSSDELRNHTGLAGRNCTADIRLRRALLFLLSYSELATTEGVAPSSSAFAGRNSL